MRLIGSGKLGRGILHYALKNVRVYPCRGKKRRSLRKKFYLCIPWRPYRYIYWVVVLLSQLQSTILPLRHLPLEVRSTWWTVARAPSFRFVGKVFTLVVFTRSSYLISTVTIALVCRVCFLPSLCSGGRGSCTSMGRRGLRSISTLTARASLLSAVTRLLRTNTTTARAR